MRRRFCRSTDARSGSGLASERALYALALLATGALAMSAAAAQDPEQNEEQDKPQVSEQLPPGQVPAVLKSREVDFIYRSNYNQLACDELRNHVAGILRALGARDDIKVRANECEAFILPDEAQMPQSAWDRSSPSMWDPNRSMAGPTDRFRNSRGGRLRGQTTPVHITVMMPVPVTPEIMEEVHRDKSRRELVSRVTGNPAAAMDDPILFAAERREVMLSRQTIGLEPEDCELLDQMTTSVFRELDLDVKGRPLACARHESSSFPPRLTVEALLPVGLLMPGEQKEKELKEKREREQQEKEKNESEAVGAVR
jgi:hypothetical protein